MQGYSIGQAAKKLNCNTSLLRFYEDFFSLEIQRTESQRRLYSEAEIEVLKKICNMRSLGMTLSQIKNDINKQDMKECSYTDNRSDNAFEEILHQLKEIKNTLCCDTESILRKENEELKEKLKQKSFEVLELKEELEYLKNNKSKRKFF